MHVYVCMRVCCWCYCKASCAPTFCGRWELRNLLSSSASFWSICGPKRRLKCRRNFRLPPWIPIFVPVMAIRYRSTFDLNRCSLPGSTFRSNLLWTGIAGTGGSGGKLRNADTRGYLYFKRSLQQVAVCHTHSVIDRNWVLCCTCEHETKLPIHTL